MESKPKSTSNKLPDQSRGIAQNLKQSKPSPSDRDRETKINKSEDSDDYGSAEKQPPPISAIPEAPNTAVAGSADTPPISVQISASLDVSNTGDYAPVEGQRPLLRLTTNIPSAQYTGVHESIKTHISSLDTSNGDRPHQLLSQPAQGILMVLAVIGAILLSPVLLVIAFIYLVLGDPGHTYS